MNLVKCFELFSRVETSFRFSAFGIALSLILSRVFQEVFPYKIGFDTAGKEPSKVYQEFDSYIDSIRPNTGKPGRRFARAVLYWRLREPRDRAPGPPRLRGGQRVDRLSLPKKSGLLLLLGCHPCKFAY